MKYKHIVFDIDGTLIDTEYAVKSSFRDLIKQFTGREVSMTDLNYILGVPSGYALAKEGLDVMGVTATEWHEKFKPYVNTITLFSGITDLVKQLKQQNYKLGLVTSESDKEYMANFYPLGIADYFEVAIKSEDTVEHKPEAAPMLEYMKRTGCTPGEVLYIGDSQYDSMCAANAGVDFALALWGAKRELPCQHKLSQPADLLKIITVK